MTERPTDQATDRPTVRQHHRHTKKKETNLILHSMTPSSAFTTLISMKQGEKTQKIVAKYVYDRFRERDRRVKYNLV